MTPQQQQPWESIAQNIQKYRDDSISRVRPVIPEVPEVFSGGVTTCNNDKNVVGLFPLNVTTVPKRVLTELEIGITESTPEGLLAALADGRFSCVDVLTAFLRRAGLAQRLVNCVTELLPEAALSRARELDQYLAEHGKPIGPLHGLPVSVKEHIGIEGLTNNCGFIAWHDRVAPETAYVLRLLLKAGAVLYVRTTEPQLLMHIETDSNLFGATVNPYNRQLTCGGSSGGEAALLALRGSCVGIGSDIGGSIRNPAAHSGIWGFRPTGYRLPSAGIHAPMSGYDSITPVIGPFSTSFEGLQIFMKVVIDQKPWLVEPSLVPLPWSYPPTDSYFKRTNGDRRLRVAFLWHDGIVRPHPPVTRCLRELRDRLQADSNIHIVDWVPYDHSRAWDIISSLYFPDGGAEERENIALSGEPWLPLSKFIVDDQPNVRELSIAELWKLNKQRDIYRSEHAKHWNSTASTNSNDEVVDVIIAPTAPGPAPPLNGSRYWNYTSQWNLLDYPALVFPFGSVSQELDTQPEEESAYQPLNGKDAENWTLWTERGGAKGYADAPIGLQIIGRRFEDEKVFEAMEWIKKVAGL